VPPFLIFKTFILKTVKIEATETLVNFYQTEGVRFQRPEVLKTRPLDRKYTTCKWICAC